MSRPKGSLNKNHSRDVTLRCEFCGKIFFVRPWRITQSKKHGRSVRFCSGSCSRKGIVKYKKKLLGSENANWKDGRTIYRTLALNAFGNRCQECGYDKHTELLWVHHKNLLSRKEQTDHSLKNLVVLCIRCHLEKRLKAQNAIQIG